MIKINNIFILKFFFIYIFIMTIYKITNIEILKFLIFVLTFSTILIFCIFIINNLQIIKKQFIYFILILFTCLFLSTIINISKTDFSFTIKYFGTFIFFLTGYIVNKTTYFNLEILKQHNKKILIIIIVPLILYFYQLLFINSGEPSSLFVNRNNAVLFGIISSYFILIFYKKTILFFIFIYSNIIIYATLGALLASIASYILIYASNVTPRKLFKILSILFLMIFALYYLFNYSELHIVERLKYSIKGFQILFSLDSIEAMSRISYGQLASQVGSGDLSFLFRIKHWFNIMVTNNQSELIYWLFGHGNDSIIALTKAELRAHNDYIRLMFEVGMIYLVVFITFNIYLVKKIGLNVYSLPFLIVLMYFFTENLLDNFLAMSLLYYFVGTIIALKEKGEI